MILPAMVNQWLVELADKKNSFQSRQNRYMMLEHMNRVVAEELRKFELELKRK